jgi:tryptophanase
MSHFQYAADRLKWLYGHRRMIGGLEFVEEPPVLRFFAGRMHAKGDWGAELAAAFEKDFGPDC